MITIGTPTAERAHRGAVAAVGHHQRGAADDRIVGGVVEHDGVARRGELVRRDDAAGGSDDVHRQIGERIERALHLVDIAMLEAGVEADEDERRRIAVRPCRRRRHGTFFVFEHRVGMAHRVPARQRRGIERGEARRTMRVSPFCRQLVGINRWPAKPACWRMPSKMPKNLRGMSSWRNTKVCTNTAVGCAKSRA